MPTAVIVDAIRTAGGKRNGRLSGWHPVDLAGEVLSILTTRRDLDPAVLDDVIVGCATQIGDQALNIGRGAALAAGGADGVDDHRRPVGHDPTLARSRYPRPIVSEHTERRGRR